ncbi:DUF2252 domain-containing protein [Catenovulum sp. 2E275]|uniref:DUF2252 domain-containing protein n=1 Tax=Catenovulum sp. 2E275 TaxID=2980497 RepID=UPI0021D2F747|nr:DUF2252 domain-containing protein [Catenovulum sp. 2E275]MCU4677133.1 DUF2252 domain-containing protein [Catenovulum sp. 2E275]
MANRAAHLNQIFIRVDGLRVDGQSSQATQNKTNLLAKHQKMALSPFLFYRGTAAVFYHDLASDLIKLPDSAQQWPLTMITGDCHLSNFGFFSEEGSHGDNVIFAPNDFDDACIGHACWDLIRFLVSIELAAFELVNHQMYTDKSVMVRLAKTEFLTAYGEMLAKLVEQNINYRFVLDKFEPEHFLSAFYKKAKKRSAKGKKFAQKSSLAKAVDLNQAQLSFKDLPDKFAKLSMDDYQQVKQKLSAYVDDVIVDIVLRLGAGTGSNNMARYYLLVGPGKTNRYDNHHLYHIVEVKQQRAAAPLFYFPNLSGRNALTPAHLTLICQQRMQRNPDLVLDRLYWKNADWLIRSRHHAKVGIDPEDLLTGNVAAHFSQYAQACGQVLALAHARADRRSHYFEQQVAESLTQIKDDLIQTAHDYAQQVIEDWQWFKTELA